MSIAKRMGFSDHAEDIAQEAVVKFLTHPKSTQSIEFAVIDAVRRVITKSRSKIKPTIVSCEFPERLSVLDERDLRSIPLPQRKKETIKRAAFILYWIWGFSFEELAVIFGGTAGSMRIMLHEAKVEMRKQGPL